VSVTAKVAALLNPSADDAIAFSANRVTGRQVRNRPYETKPYWDVERARLGDAREVPVELVVNGIAVATKNLVADGALRDMTFDNVKLDRSSWVAMRILPTSHTNPVFVIVGDRPIRARRSIEWCLQSLEKCWEQKQRFYTKPGELELAQAAWDHARQVYRARLAEAGE